MKYRDLVHEIALDNHGYVTTQAAVEAGVPAVELPKLAARGGMENVAYGLYRVSTVPRSEIEQFTEALCARARVPICTGNRCLRCSASPT